MVTTKQTRKNITPIISLALVFFFLLSTTTPIITTPCSSAEIQSKSEPTSHNAISVNCNNAFVSQAASEGWAGNGTKGNPYIIENYDINASSANGIDIRNIDMYFIIRNCVIHDGKNNNYGVYVYNSIHGEIKNCNVYNNNVGIYLDESSNNNIITNCSVYNNSGDGIQLHSSSNNNITNCNVYNNSGEGIWMHDSSNNNQITNCDVHNNDENGIYLVWSSDNIIINCDVYNNHDVGIHLTYSSNNQITNCTIYNNYYGIYLYCFSNNQINNCRIYNNSDIGIYVYYSSYNNIINCDVYNNYYGIYLQSSYSDEIHYNNIYNNTYYGVYNLFSGSSYAGDATYCWWDDASGPYHPDTNPSGTGDNVSDNVIYEPWLYREVLPLIVTVSANPATVNSGETSTITVTVTDDINPVPGVTINIESDNDGNFSSVIDNGNDNYTAIFTTPIVTARTVYRITAQATKTGYINGSNYVDITVNPAAVVNHAPIINSVTTNITTISTGETVTITVVATDEDVGNTLTYHYNCTGGTISGSGLTVTWTAPDTTGDYIIMVYVNDGIVDSNSKSVIITVTHIVTESFEDPDTGTNVTAQYTGTGNITITSASSPGAPPSGMHDINVFVEIIAPETMTIQWVYIGVPYNESELSADVDESKLKLFCWTDTGWEKCENTNVDTTNNIVYANVTHLTIFAPMAERSAANGEGGISWFLYSSISIIMIIIIVYVSISIMIKKKKNKGGEI